MNHSSDGSFRFLGERTLGWAGLLAVPILAGILISTTPARAADGPLAPCTPGEAAPLPAFGDPPNGRNWHPGDIPAAWSPPACMPWAAQQFTVLTALAGSFKFDGTADDLLVKFGAMSAWRGIQYWSVTDGRWNILIADAAALDGSSPRRRRGDFTLPELKSGADLYFLQQDNRSSDAVTYRMKVEESEPNRLIITVENVSSVSMFIFTIFDAGDLQSTYIFERLSPTTWGYYNLSGAREGAALIGNHDSSYLNRALAIYRHLAGIPGNQEPPLAR
jgi:uncharacterized protein DUF6675